MGPRRGDLQGRAEPSDILFTVPGPVDDGVATPSTGDPLKFLHPSGPAR